MKNVMLKIEGTQNLDGEENKIELVTEGKMYEKENALYLVYEETELSGMEGCTTTVKVAKDKISLRRYGTSQSEIIFQIGKKHASSYHTPYGNFDMEVITTDMECSITDTRKGSISIEYDVNLQGLMESRNKLSIRIM